MVNNECLVGIKFGEFIIYTLPKLTIHVLNFMGKIFVFLVGKKIHGVLIFVAMVAW